MRRPFNLLHVLVAIVNSAKELEVFWLVAAAFPFGNDVVDLKLILGSADASVGMLEAARFIALEHESTACSADSLTLTRLYFLSGSNCGVFL
jgi:hypothetical protein